MRHFLLVSLSLFWLGSCSEDESLEAEGLTAEELRSLEVGFGWNFEIERDAYTERYLDVVILPDNTFEIYLGEFRSDSEPMILDTSAGQLEASVAAELRRELQPFLSKSSAANQTPLEGCPVTAHADIEYFIGFAYGAQQFMTILEAPCQTQEAERLRSAVDAAFATFPEIDREDLKAGNTNL